MSKPNKNKNKENKDLGANNPKKYINEKRIDELEKMLNDEKTRCSKLLETIKLLQSENKEKEALNVKTILSYDYKIEDLQNQLRNYDSQNSKQKLELETIRDELNNYYKDLINDLKDKNEKRYNKLLTDFESEKQKCAEYKSQKKELKQEVEDLKNERVRINETLMSTISKHEVTLKNTITDYQEQIQKYIEKEQIYLKEKEFVNENEIYAVYKELKNKFEKNLNELKDFKNINSQILDENKIIKYTMESSDNILKECAKIQIQKQKLLNQYKQVIENQNNEIARINTVFDETKENIVFQYSEMIKNLNKEIVHLKSDNNSLKQENKKIKALSQMILDQRNEVEVYFLESLEEVKKEIYKRKKMEQRKFMLFPTINKKYKDPIEEIGKISIKDLTPEDKEKMLKLLFCKINENITPKSYLNFENEEFFIKNVKSSS